MSLEAHIGRLQMFFKHQKQRNKGKKNKKRRKRTPIFCFKIFEEKALDLF